MVEFRFPDVGEGIVEGEIVRWLVRAGEAVRAHQPLVEMETDKAVVELPAPCAGTVRELRGAEGERVPVGAVLAVLDEENESARPQAAGVVGALEEAPAAGTPRLLPRDRKLAETLGVDPGRLAGSGPQGRITEEEIRAAAEGGKRLPLSGVRRAMARTMTAASGAVPVTLMERADGLALGALLERERDLAEERGVRLTWLPFLLKSLALTLEAFPLLNSSLDGEEIVLHDRIDLGIAVDTPDGLLVPVLRDARRRSVLELAAAVQDLAARGRSRKLAPGELKGGTFTVSNYGALGGIWGTPVIVPPQAAILGIGRIADTPTVRDGAVVAHPAVPLSLTFDHRILDGATAQRFLNAVVGHIENPDLILLES